MSDQQDPSNYHNRGGLFAFMFCMVFVFSFFFYLVAIHKGVDLDEKVVDPHAVSASGVKLAYNVDDNKEPWVSSEDMIAHGQKVYQSNCALCHGQNGDLVGGIANARNLVEGQWTQGAGAISHFKVLQNGIAGSSMASWSHLKVGDRWALVQYIQSITQNKGSDDPAKVAEFAKTAK